MKNLNEEILRSKKMMGIKEGLNLPKINQPETSPESSPESELELFNQKPEDFTLTCNITLEGYNYADLVDAAREVLRLLDAESREGGDNNMDSSYSFEVTGEEWNAPPDNDDDEFNNLGDN